MKDYGKTLRGLTVGALHPIHQSLFRQLTVGEGDVGGGVGGTDGIGGRSVSFFRSATKILMVFPIFTEPAYATTLISIFLINTKSEPLSLQKLRLCF